ncbi:MAG: MHYT domain-containing protein [Gemmatimonadales bacterium]
MTTLLGRYDPYLVALSVLIAVLAAGAALDLASRVTHAKGRFQILWLMGGAFAMGLGIWSMHYTGMLAFALPIPVYYHVATVVLSLLAAVGASGVALYVASRDQLDLGRIALGSLAMGAGIAGMHYIGMAAMRLSGTMLWNILIVAVSVAIAILVSTVALWFAFRYGRPTAGAWSWRKVGSAVLMGVAIPAMHYTGMAAATFQSVNLPVDVTGTVDISTLGAYAIGGGTLLVLAMAIGTSLVSRYGEEQLRASESRYRVLAEQLASAQATAHVGSWEWDLRRNVVTWSDELRRIYGVSSASPAGYTEFLERAHPDDRQRLEDLVAKTLATRQAVDYEWQCIRPDGEVRHILGRNVVVTDESGQVVRMAGTSLDISERKRAEAELRQAMAEVKTLQGILPICASCKRIRAEHGQWQAVESYVREHSNAEFSHGLCPDCAARDWGTVAS